MALNRWYPGRDAAFWVAGVVKSAAAATAAAVVGCKDAPEKNYFFWGSVAVFSAVQIAETAAARFWTVKSGLHPCKNRYNASMLMTILEAGAAVFAGYSAGTSDHCEGHKPCFDDLKVQLSLGAVAALLLLQAGVAYCLRPTINSPPLLGVNKPT